MSLVLLADDSPHAQRMGERILTGEGFEVVTVSSGDAALVRLEDVAPDVILADAIMPGRSGYEVCRYVRMSPRHQHTRLVVTAGALETLNEAEASQAGADATLRKPFEATALLEIVRRLSEEARVLRGQTPAPEPATARQAPVATSFVAVIEPEKVRAAVTVALDASMDAMVDEITSRVLAALAAAPKP
jgi:CheY-like chemotaxis protein